MSAIANHGLGCHCGGEAPHVSQAVASGQEASLRNWMHAAGATTIVVVLQLLLRAMLMLRRWNY
ncbi:MAG: hypothetical protein ACRD5R_17410 [Candidatus Acidiferrales bacterium]